MTETETKIALSKTTQFLVEVFTYSYLSNQMFISTKSDKILSQSLAQQGLMKSPIQLDIYSTPVDVARYKQLFLYGKNIPHQIPGFSLVYVQDSRLQIESE